MLIVHTSFSSRISSALLFISPSPFCPIIMAVGNYADLRWILYCLQAGADRSECVRECARAIFLDNDYGEDLHLSLQPLMQPADESVFVLDYSTYHTVRGFPASSWYLNVTFFVKEEVRTALHENVLIIGADSHISPFNRKSLE